MGVIDGQDGFNAFTNPPCRQDRRKFIKVVAAKMVLALEEMRSLSRVHNDIKPLNIMVDRGQIKIIDFGSSLNVSSNEDLPCTGTEGFVAPERRFDVCNRNDFLASDLYSLGAMLEVYELMRVIPYSSFDKDLRDLIDWHLMVSDPVLRYQRMKDIRSHRYFAGVDWEQMARNETELECLIPIQVIVALIVSGVILVMLVVFFFAYRRRKRRLMRYDCEGVGHVRPMDSPRTERTVNIADADPAETVYTCNKEAKDDAENDQASDADHDQAHEAENNQASDADNNQASDADIEQANDADNNQASAENEAIAPQ